MVPVNFWAVIVATIVMHVIGWVWFGPLFGKKWAHLSGISMGGNKKSMGSVIALSIISSLVMCYILSHALVFASTYLHTSGASAGFMTGFWNWLGFIAPVTLGVVIWENKSWKLWAITSGYYLVSLCVAGIILASWM